VAASHRIRKKTLDLGVFSEKSNNHAKNELLLFFSKKNDFVSFYLIEELICSKNLNASSEIVRIMK
jgi:hypothetical protein